MGPLALVELTYGKLFSDERQRQQRLKDEREGGQDEDETAIKKEGPCKLRLNVNVNYRSSTLTRFLNTKKSRSIAIVQSPPPSSLSHQYLSIMFTLA